MAATAPAPPIESSCFWLARRPARPAEVPPPAAADVVVVGGGFTGLWTALFLRELAPDTSVVLLEAETCAYGASGRNAGIVGETLDHSHALAERHFGTRAARRLAAIGRQNLDELERFLAARGIDAGFERTGQLIFALDDGHRAALAAEAAAAERLGVADLRLLSPEEARARIASPLYRGALVLPRNALVDPVRLVDGLRAEAERRGVVVCEGVPVAAIESIQAGVAVRTRHGSVRARRAVLATNAWSGRLLPRLQRRFLPLYDYIVVSERLSPEQRAALGWAGREGATDARAFFNYYRLTADDRLLWGTSEAVYYPRHRVDPACDHSAAHTAALQKSLRRFFPALAGLALPYAWGGPICSTTRLTPFFGSALGGRLHYGLGYTGHGIASTRVAGRILAHLALERESPLLELDLVRSQPKPFPPGPLRTWGVRAVTRALRRVDAGAAPSGLLRLLDALGVSFSS